MPQFPGFKKNVLNQVVFSLLLIATTHYLNCQSYNDQDVISIMVLGTAQDAGYPQINCQKKCCQKARNEISSPTFISCLGLILKDGYYLFDATPDIKYQIELVHKKYPHLKGKLPEGIFLTHAHIGHYTGLMQLGREAINSSGLKVYAMPRMKSFLEENGPWSQLVKLDNIRIHPLSNLQSVFLKNKVTVKPFLVPHRDEFSETVGFEINAADNKVIFIPDIDKWTKWKNSINDIVHSSDLAFIDATFYDIEELPNRNMDEIPHPFVVESMELLAPMPRSVKNKVHFIHFNHSNPLLDDNSAQSQTVISKGFRIARQGEVINLE